MPRGIACSGHTSAGGRSRGLAASDPSEGSRGARSNRSRQQRFHRRTSSDRGQATGARRKGLPSNLRAANDPEVIGEAYCEVQSPKSESPFHFSFKAPRRRRNSSSSIAPLRK